MKSKAKPKTKHPTMRLCSFDSGVKRTKRTEYENFKRGILEAGRFSVWREPNSACKTLALELLTALDDRDELIDKLQVDLDFYQVEAVARTNTDGRTKP